MRQLVVAIAVFVIAMSSHAQSSTTAAAPKAPTAVAAPADAPPPLTKTVVINPGDSALVRAAKLAVASRQNANQRHVVNVINTGGGKVSQGTGTMGNLPAPPTTSTPPAQGKSWDQQLAEQRAAREQQRTQELKQEQERMGSEMDEPYGGDVEEDDAERRMSEAGGVNQAPPAPKPPQQ